MLGPYALLAGGAIAVAALSGAYLTGEHNQANADRVTFQKVRDDWQAERDKARALLDAANQRVAKAEHDGAAALAAAATDYERRQSDEKVKSDALVQRLRTGADSLRVAVATVHRDCIDVSNPAAGSGRSDGQEVATIARPAAARLAERYAGYNALIAQLDLAQQVIATDRQICNGSGG